MIARRFFPVRDYNDAHQPIRWSIPIGLLVPHAARLEANHGYGLEIVHNPTFAGLHPREILAVLCDAPLPIESVSMAGTIEERAARRHTAREDLAAIVEAWRKAQPESIYTESMRVAFQVGTAEREGVIPVTPEELAGFRANGITGGLVGIRVLLDAPVEG